MTDEQLTKLLKIWSGEKYKDVMLPAAGAMTCGQAAQAILSLADSDVPVCKDGILPTTEQAAIINLAMMLRRMIWMAEKQTGDTSLKVLTGNAKQLLAKYDLQGSPLRAPVVLSEARK